MVRGVIHHFICKACFAMSRFFPPWDWFPLFRFRCISHRRGGGLTGVLKLADFGMATAYGEGVDGVGDGQEGDTLYMAKELLSSVERLPSADMFR